MTETLTIDHAYRAMHHFVNAYWERGGKRGAELTLFLSYLAPRWSPTDDNPWAPEIQPHGMTGSTRFTRWLGDRRHIAS